MPPGTGPATGDRARLGRRSFGRKRGALLPTHVANRNVDFSTYGTARAQKSELRHILQTFFGGSTENAVATLLDLQPLDEDAKARLKTLIDEASEEGR